MPLFVLIGALMDLYESGADFVDVLKTEDTDTNIGLAIRPEYLNPEVTEQQFSDNIDNLKEDENSMLSKRFVDREDVYDEIEEKEEVKGSLDNLDDIIDSSI